MLQSKHLSAFQKLGNLAPSILRGNRLIVEVLPKEELKTAGGLIVASSLSDHRSETEANRPTMAIVLAAGAGYFDSDSGKDVPLDIQPGNVILVSQLSLKYLTEVPGYTAYVKNTNDQIALTRESEIHMRWASIAEYETYKYILNA